MSKKSEIAKILTVMGMTTKETEILKVIRQANEVTARLYKNLLTPAERDVAQAMGISFSEAARAKYREGTPEAQAIEQLQARVDRLQQQATGHGNK